MSDAPRRDPVAEVLRAAVRGRRHEPCAAAEPHSLDARLEHLERDVQEVRTRVNALFFTVIAAVIGDVVGRVVSG